MNQSYIKLFTNLANTTSVLAEQVMEFDRQKQDSSGEATAKNMREDYSNLYDKFRDEKFSVNQMNKRDFAKLLVGAILVTQQIENRIKQEQTAVTGYKSDVMPKLERIINETTTDEEAIKLANELFEIKSENSQEKSESNV